MNITKVLLAVLFQATLLKMCTAQNKISFYYIMKDEKQLSTPIFAFSIANLKGSYIFSFKADTAFVTYPDGGADTIISKSSFGPYKFKRKGRQVYLSYKSEGKWEENEYYLLQKDTSYLIPDIFSTTPNSYNIICSLMDENSIVENGGINILSFKFFEIQKNNHGSSYRIVYVDKNTLLPIRMENYQDAEYKKLSSIIANIPKL